MMLRSSILLLVTLLTKAYSANDAAGVSVISVHLPDGQHQIRAHGSKVFAMDTLFANLGGRLRELSDGLRYVKVLYSPDDEVVECQVESEPNEVDKLLGQIGAKYEKLDMAEIARAVDDLQDAVVSNMELKDGDEIEHFKKMIDFDYHISLCGSHYNSKASSGVSKRRSPRSTFIFPGTNWCGIGNVNEGLGETVEVDMCCRQHDRCPYYIESMKQNWGHLNMRLYTISHCACDEEFRTCLRLAGSQSANAVGNWFFNWLQLECFVFKPTTRCVLRAWYGKCLREENIHEADIKDPLSF